MVPKDCKLNNIYQICEMTFNVLIDNKNIKKKKKMK